MDKGGRITPEETVSIKCEINEAAKTKNRIGGIGKDGSSATGMIKELRYHDFEYSFFEKYDRFDYGASLGAAVLISKHYSIRAHYQLGLNSNYPNRCIGINLGYYF